MILRYGSYSHALNEAAVSIQRQTLENERGPYAVRHLWTIDGLLQGDDQAEVSQKITELQEAYTVGKNTKNLELLFDNGSKTAHGIVGADCVDGVRVAGLSFPEGRGAEYSTFRTYRIELVADQPDQLVGILSFEEFLSFSGGGPKHVWLQPLKGPPVFQQVHTHTLYTARQSGRAVGHLAYPLIPAPLWPNYEAVNQRQVGFRSPRRKFGPESNLWIEYEVTWDYAFESKTPLSGFPNKR